MIKWVYLLTTILWDLGSNPKLIKLWRILLTSHTYLVPPSGLFWLLFPCHFGPKEPTRWRQLCDVSINNVNMLSLSSKLSLPHSETEQRRRPGLAQYFIWFLSPKYRVVFYKSHDLLLTNHNIWIQFSFLQIGNKFYYRRYPYFWEL